MKFARILSLALILRATLTPKIGAQVSSMTDRELHETIKIIAPQFFRGIEDHPDSSFISAVETYKADQDFVTRPDTPDKNEWWEEIIARFEWCKENLKTQIDEFPRDIRWEYILLLGTDYEERIITIGGQTDFETKIWVLDWPKVGRKLAFEADKGGVVPVRLHPWGEGDDLVANDPIKGKSHSATKGEKAAARAAGLPDAMAEAVKVVGAEPKFAPFPGLQKPIKTNFIFSTLLPDESYNDYPVWLSTFTRADQLTDSTVASDSLLVVVSIYDSNQKFVGQAYEVATGLRSLDTLSKSEYAIPIYVGIRLPEGHYTSVISLIGDSKRNMGLYINPIDIPPSTASWIKMDSSIFGTSDILFPIAGLMRGSGVEVDGQQVPNVAYPVLSRRDKLPIAIQMQVPKGTSCRIVATFYRITEQMFWRISTRQQEHEHVVFQKMFRSTTGREFFKANLDLLSLKEPGEYAVTIRVVDLKDAEGEHPYGISWRKFRVTE